MICVSLTRTEMLSTFGLIYPSGRTQAPCTEVDSKSAGKPASGARNLQVCRGRANQGSARGIYPGSIEVESPVARCYGDNPLECALFPPGNLGRRRRAASTFGIYLRT